MKNVILRAADLDGFLKPEDRERIDSMDRMYSEALKLSSPLSEPAGTEGAESAGGARAAGGKKKAPDVNRLIALYNDMGKAMQKIVKEYGRIHVYSFETPDVVHGEASRLIAKLRSAHTEQPEFIYYIQRAYELLFTFAFTGGAGGKKNYKVVQTPVSTPVRNFAVHKIPDVDEKVTNSVMCVMLRGALLPSMILSKEIQEYSSDNYVTPFALFSIRRDDSKEEKTLEYILNLDRSYFDIEALNGKDLFFADPMNATGGSLITVIRYLESRGVNPRSIAFFNVVSVLKGSLRIVRALEQAEIYTLWLDPALNIKAYIMPGLGDAGDRINGPDLEEHPRDIIQLIADYGSPITSLYRSQIRKIEETVLGRKTH